MQIATISAIPESLTITSREIAELTNKEHAHVLRDIRTLKEQLGDMFEGYVQSWIHPQNKQTYEEFSLGKDTCITLLLGYDSVARMKVVKRWGELERGAGVSLPNFANPAEAARAWAVVYEEKNAALALAHEATRTKAEIGSRREATAMATASSATRKANELERQLDKAKDYATVKRMTMLHHGIKFDWRKLRDASVAMEVPAIDVFDQNYGTVKAYHKSVWLEAYAVGIHE